MNINLRALVFGATVAAVLTVTMNNVAATETPNVVRLDAVEVVAHRDFDNQVVRLEPVVVIAHKNAAL
jgi:hypothetical protein